MLVNDIQTPKKTYNQYLNEFGLQLARQKVYEYFDAMYFSPNPRKNEIKIKDFKQLFPGRICTFKYNPLNYRTLDYYDKQPVVLTLTSYKSESTGNLITTGVNLNFLPNIIRLNILDILFKYFRNVIEKDLQKKRTGEYIGSPLYVFDPSIDYLGLVDYLLGVIARSGYKYAVRSYIFTRMKAINYIEYDDWGLLAFIESKDMMKWYYGDVQKQYWDLKIQGKL